MPGFTDAGVSSAPLERPKGRGNRGPQIACDTSAHMSRREGLLRVLDPRTVLPSQRGGQPRSGLGAYDGTVHVWTVIQRYMIQLTQTQTVTSQDLQDLTGAARQQFVKRRAFGLRGGGGRMQIFIPSRTAMRRRALLWGVWYSYLFLP